MTRNKGLVTAGVSVWVMLTSLTGNAQGLRGVSINGAAEGGFTYSSRPGSIGGSATKQTQFLLDRLGLKLTADISERSRVVVDNEFSIGTSASAAGTLALQNNSSSYFSNATLASGTSNRFTYSNASAYLEYKWSKGISSSLGHVTVPFGLESMQGRYDSHYHHSEAYKKATSYQWYHDVGLKFDVRDLLPGHLEVAVIDGRNNPVANAAVAAGTTSESSFPGIAGRWQITLGSGDLAITPSFSVFAARFRGSPKDLGFGAGVRLRKNSLWANAEWLYVSHTTILDGTAKSKDYSVYVEPGYSMDLFDVSLKADYNSSQTDPGAAANDLNLSAALSHNYEGGYRVRLAYEFSNMLEKQGVAKGHDVRLLFGMKW